MTVIYLSISMFKFFQISRALAAKCALASRVDALGEDDNVEMGIESRAKLEARVRQLEEGVVRSSFILTYPCIIITGCP